jgi:RES domain-containing protein
VKFFRLEAASRPSPADAFSGLGGLHAGGRWHSLGGRVVYASQSLALASLEKLVHAHSPSALTGLNYFEIEIPDAAVEVARDLPKDWNAEPAGFGSKMYGDRWRIEQRTVALQVPSAVVPIEFNCLINPAHPGFKLKWVKGPHSFDYDPRIKAAYAAALASKRRRK